MSGLTTCLWFDGRGEEAADFYVAAFRACGREAAKADVVRNTPATPGPDGSALTVSFTLDGQDFLALNGGPHFTFSPAISIVVRCADQDEIDRVWSALSQGGAPGRCGWLTDRFGLSWQVVPHAIAALVGGRNGDRVMAAIMGMGKLDLAAMRAAAEG